MPEVAALWDYESCPERAWQMPEERFLHALLIVAAAADAGFQARVERVAARFGMTREDKTFQPAPPKAFVRANNKKTSDYRYYPMPRTGFNVDVARNLCACPAEHTVAFYAALVEEWRRGQAQVPARAERGGAGGAVHPRRSCSRWCTSRA